LCVEFVEAGRRVCTTVPWTAAFLRQLCKCHNVHRRWSKPSSCVVSTRCHRRWSAECHPIILGFV